MTFAEIVEALADGKRVFWAAFRNEVRSEATGIFIIFGQNNQRTRISSSSDEFRCSCLACREKADIYFAVEAGVELTEDLIPESTRKAFAKLKKVDLLADLGILKRVPR